MPRYHGREAWRAPPHGAMVLRVTTDRCITFLQTRWRWSRVIPRGWSDDKDWPRGTAAAAAEEHHDEELLDSGARFAKFGGSRSLSAPNRPSGFSMESLVTTPVKDSSDGGVSLALSSLWWQRDGYVQLFESPRGLLSPAWMNREVESWVPKVRGYHAVGMARESRRPV
jgi:hypothetical protein